MPRSNQSTLPRSLTNGTIPMRIFRYPDDEDSILTLSEVKDIMNNDQWIISSMEGHAWDDTEVLPISPSFLVDWQDSTWDPSSEIISSFMKSKACPVRIHVKHVHTKSMHNTA